MGGEDGRALSSLGSRKHKCSSFWDSFLAWLSNWPRNRKSWGRDEDKCQRGDGDSWDRTRQ
jgi:hypothetical protein